MNEINSKIGKIKLLFKPQIRNKILEHRQKIKDEKK